MRKVSDVAIDECMAEVRAACRRPIDQSALDIMVLWVRPNFERILDRIDGGRRWAEFGQRVRNNSRHLGALADFFANHVDATEVGINELTTAFTLARADCSVRSERTPLAAEFCHPSNAQLELEAAETFLRTIAPLPELARRAG